MLNAIMENRPLVGRPQDDLPGSNNTAPGQNEDPCIQVPNPQARRLVIQPLIKLSEVLKKHSEMGSTVDERMKSSLERYYGAGNFEHVTSFSAQGEFLPTICYSSAFMQRELMTDEVTDSIAKAKAYLQRNGCQQETIDLMRKSIRDWINEEGRLHESRSVQTATFKPIVSLRIARAADELQKLLANSSQYSSGVLIVHLERHQLNFLTDNRIMVDLIKFQTFQELTFKKIRRMLDSISELLAGSEQEHRH